MGWALPQSIMLTSAATITFFPCDTQWASGGYHEEKKNL
jgi:hypothetical protein